MTAIDVAQQYFDGWNRRDPAAVLATMAEGGTYTDPGTHGPISGEVFAVYMQGLFAAFPDMVFAIASVGLAAPDLVAAQWIMRGTNRGSMMGLPPTGKTVEVNGADFIRVADGRIRSVEGYFDSRAVPEQLGLQIVVQPKAIGSFTFGTAVRTWGGSTAKPGAFSVTALQSRSFEDENAVRERSRVIAAELLGMKGFIGFVGATIGDRLLTITAWEGPDNPNQVMKNSTHAEAMGKFHSAGQTLGGGGFTSVFVPERINTMWGRCPSCQKMADRAAMPDTCGCGAALPAPFPYW